MKHMRLTDIISNSNPAGAWTFDSVSNKFVNLLGTGNIGPASTPSIEPAVSYNGPIGALLTTGNSISTTFAYAGNTGTTQKPFTVEFVGFPSSGPAGLFVNSTNGLFWTGTAFEFRLTFASGVKTVSYQSPLQVAHLLGVYSPGNMELWLNGVQVATTTIDDVDTVAGFTVSGTTWTGPTTNSVIANAVALYRRAFTAVEASEHWIEPQANPYNTAYTNRSWTMSNSDRQVIINKTWQQADWEAGLFTVGQANGTKFQLYAGTWKSAMPVNQADIVEVRPTWDGTITFLKIWKDSAVSVTPADNDIVPIASSAVPAMLEISMPSPSGVDFIEAFSAALPTDITKTAGVTYDGAIGQPAGSMHTFGGGDAWIGNVGSQWDITGNFTLEYDIKHNSGADATRDIYNMLVWGRLRTGGNLATMDGFAFRTEVASNTSGWYTTTNGTHTGSVGATGTISAMTPNVWYHVVITAVGNVLTGQVFDKVTSVSLGSQTVNVTSLLDANHLTSGAFGQKPDGAASTTGTWVDNIDVLSGGVATGIDNFNLIGYKDLIMTGSNPERTITIDSGVKTYDVAHPLLMHAMRNTYIPATKKIVISIDTSSANIKNIGAVEMWCKAGASGATGTTIITGTTMYVNGVTGTTLPANTWVHVVFNRTADNTAITINGELSIASLNVYETTRSNPEAVLLYTGWIETPRITQREAMSALTDDTPAARIYDSVWTPAGR